MTNIKKLFLTLSLLAMQSTFGMEQTTKKPRTADNDESEWTLVTTNQALAQHANNIIAGKPLDPASLPKYYFIRPAPPSLWPDPDDHLYVLYTCERGSSPRTFNCSISNRHLARFPWQVRRLTFGEARYLHHGIQSKDILVNKETFSIIDGSSSWESVLPDEGRDFFRLSHLTPNEQTRYVIHNYLKFPPTLLGIRRYRKSALDLLPRDVVAYMCQLAFVDAHRNDIPLEFE